MSDVMTAAGPDAIVVGAGISGLTAAFRLQERGLSVMVLEAAPAIGGKMGSVRRDGFVMNRAATILPSSYATLLELAADAGVTEPITPMETAFGIPRGGRMHHLRASGLGQAVDGLRTELLSRRSKLLLRRAAIDAWRMRKSLGYDDLDGAARLDTETVAQYTSRRLNVEIHEYVVAPLLRAIFLVEAEEMSVVDFFFTLTNLFGGGLLQYPAGVDFLCRALAESLDVRTDAQVQRVERVGGGVEVTWHDAGEERSQRARGCVVAVCGRHVPALVPGLDARQLELLESLPYGAIVKGVFALRGEPAGTPTVIAVPQSEDPDLGVVCFDSRSMPGSVPTGKAAVSGYWMHEWSVSRMDLPDEDLVEEMIPAMERVIPGFTGLLEFAHVERWNPAALASRQGLYCDLAELRSRIDPQDPIQLAGDYFGVPSTNGCAVSGEQAAQRLSAQLARAPVPA